MLVDDLKAVNLRYLVAFILSALLFIVGLTVTLVSVEVTPVSEYSDAVEDWQSDVRNWFGSLDLYVSLSCQCVNHDHQGPARHYPTSIPRLPLYDGLCFKTPSLLVRPLVEFDGRLTVTATIYAATSNPHTAHPSLTHTPTPAQTPAARTPTSTPTPILPGKSLVKVGDVSFALFTSTFDASSATACASDPFAAVVYIGQDAYCGHTYTAASVCVGVERVDEFGEGGAANPAGVRVVEVDGCGASFVTLNTTASLRLDAVADDTVEARASFVGAPRGVGAVTLVGESATARSAAVAAAGGVAAPSPSSPPPATIPVPFPIHTNYSVDVSSLRLTLRARGDPAFVRVADVPTGARVLPSPLSQRARRPATPSAPSAAPSDASRAPLGAMRRTARILGGDTPLRGGDGVTSILGSPAESFDADIDPSKTSSSSTELVPAYRTLWMMPGLQSRGVGGVHPAVRAIGPLMVTTGLVLMGAMAASLFAGRASEGWVWFVYS